VADDKSPMQVNNTGINIRKPTTVRDKSQSRNCCITLPPATVPYHLSPYYFNHRAVQEFTSEDYQRLMSTNLESAFNLSQVRPPRGTCAPTSCMTSPSRLTSISLT
jgi:NAD(P)-dependent dehydrogenase (short-subunit alcohol dehydrogenase family)